MRFYQRADGEWVTARPSGKCETLEVDPTKQGILGLLNTRCRGTPPAPLVTALGQQIADAAKRAGLPPSAEPGQPRPRSKLPLLCPFKHPVFDEIVWAGSGLAGYFRKPVIDEAAATAYRVDHEITLPQLAAMAWGALHGWKTARADPDFYDDHGQPRVAELVEATA